ncbi:ribosome small subunit-dependent GTPase A [Hugonella massiliensis]|uniref:ribosome small subunit-dependent GTPase A n=1 Tax=Hugonella massiliensis TaxID=1720315 RepID=UPI00073E91C5|nr:ribosome small subunit-dependent GTPase A [Hugonella massiliensis]
MREAALVVQIDRGFPLVETADGRRFRCKHAVSLVKGADVRAQVGDRVMVDVADDADIAQIAAIEPRTRELVRRDPAERTVAQVLAVNFDTVIVAHPLHELNERRLERELVLAQSTGAQVVVALTKADLAESSRQVESVLAHVRAMAAPGVEVVAVSEHDPASVERLRAFIPAGTTAVLIGRSGVGKSSLVNLLAGRDVQETNAVRETDGKGRHTTVNRSMVALPQGGYVVDMPGVRGLGLWDSREGIDAAFPDVAGHAADCRFRDCTHGGEPGCAVQAAVTAGELSSERVASYVRLVAENAEQMEKNEVAARMRGRGKPRPRRRRR